MKIELLGDGAVLRLMAESGPELDVVSELKGVHAPGPMAAAKGIRVPMAEVGFEFDERQHGVHYMAGGGTNTLVGLEVPLAWLRCEQPAAPEVALRRNVALRIGHGLLDALDLLQAQRPQ